MLSPESFLAVTDMFHRVSGIRLVDAKRPLVAGRLQKLAQERGLRDVDHYVSELLRQGDPAELERVVDKLTTNETYFFREPQHFEHLAALIERRPRRAAPLRVWSAASSSGEEAYSIAMLLADQIGPAGWSVVGTDLSTSVVESARQGLYSMERARHVPPAYLKRWCLKGHGEHEGRLLMCRELREKVRFECANLTQPMPQLGTFDVIFLRNVLIYFDNPGKTGIVRNVLGHLAADGVLYTGHAESITNLGLPVRSTASAVYVHG